MAKAKRPSLSSLRSVARGEAATRGETAAATAQEETPTTTTAAVSVASSNTTTRPSSSTSRRPRQASRVGLKSVTFHISEEAHEVLAIMAIKKRRTQESLLKEGLNDLLAKYGENPIA